MIGTPCEAGGGCHCVGLLALFKGSPSPLHPGRVQPERILSFQSGSASLFLSLSPFPLSLILPPFSFCFSPPP